MSDDITAGIAVGSCAPLSLFASGYFKGSGDFDPSPNQAILSGVTGQNGYLVKFADATNSINELSGSDLVLSMYPNPSDGNFNIEIIKKQK